MYRKSMLLVTLLISFSAWSGQGTGNGGDVVICEDSNGSLHTVLLDVYETTENHGLKVEFDSRSGDAVQKARYQINKLKGWYLQEYYLKKIDAFYSRVKFIETDLEDVPDSFHTYIPRNCELKQVALNYEDGTIEINQKLWNSLDDNNQGALIIHELFYEDAIKSGLTNSIAVRQNNSYIHGNYQMEPPVDGIYSEIESNLYMSFKRPKDDNVLIKYLLDSPYDHFKSKVIHRHILPDEKFRTSILFLDFLKKELQAETILSKNLTNWLNQFPVLNWKDEKYESLKEYFLYTAGTDLKKLTIINSFTDEGTLPEVIKVFERLILSTSFNQGSYTRIIDDFYKNLVPQLHSVGVQHFIEREALRFSLEKGTEGSTSKGFIRFLENVANLKSVLNKNVLFLLEACIRPLPDYKFTNAMIINIFLENHFKEEVYLEKLRDSLGQESLYIQPDRTLDIIAKSSQTLELATKLITELGIFFEKNIEVRPGISSFIKIYSQYYNPVPRILIPKVINLLKRNSYERLDGTNVIYILMNIPKPADEIKNFSAYLLRNQNVYLDRRDVLNWVRHLDSFTPYVFSVIENEIKLHFSEDQELLIILQCLEEKGLTPLLTDMLTQLSKESPYQRIQETAQSLLVQK